MVAFCATVCATLFLVSPITHAQAHTFTVAFHRVNGLILLEGQLSDQPTTFLLDTGASVSFVDMHTARSIQFKADKVRRVGMTGCIVAHEKLIFGGRDFSEQGLCVADLSDVSKSVGTRIDGFVGQNFLRTFSAVRIDYKAQTVTLEE